MDDDAQAKPISRRRMLKRIGAGTAIAWSTPVLSSIATPAFAASPSCPPDKALCNGQDPICGAPGVACSLPPGCGFGFCTLMLDNSCLCWDSASCTSPNPICQQDSDCGPGNKCGFVDPSCTNCAGNRACFHPCGGGGSLPARPGATVVRA